MSGNGKKQRVLVDSLPLEFTVIRGADSVSLEFAIPTAWLQQVATIDHPVASFCLDPQQAADLASNILAQAYRVATDQGHSLHFILPATPARVQEADADE